MVKQVEAQRDSGGLQPFAELGHDARGVEAAFDVSAGPKSQLLEQVDVLQADDVSAGSRDLADVADAAAIRADARCARALNTARCLCSRIARIFWANAPLYPRNAGRSRSRRISWR